MGSNVRNERVEGLFSCTVWLLRLLQQNFIQTDRKSVFNYKNIVDAHQILHDYTLSLLTYFVLLSHFVLLCVRLIQLIQFYIRFPSFISLFFIRHEENDGIQGIFRRITNWKVRQVWGKVTPSSLPVYWNRKESFQFGKTK